ncbi:MAG: hypothetical protein HY996_05330 [Micrococcales bacterium]|nr:hypothetical protein [Micrococcales bacterium]
MSDSSRSAHPESSTAAHPDATASGAVAAERGNTTREDVLEREKDAYGGMKFGAAFFGWLAATGVAVILLAVIAAIGALVGLNGLDPSQAANTARDNAATVGIVGGIVLAATLLVAYFCGGYVAGRMARFNGAKQGVAVWLWAIVIAIVLAILGAIAGSSFNVLNRLSSLPQVPLDGGAVTLGGVVEVIVVLIVSLIGAVLGGLSGMRFHRKVDRAGLGR